MIRLGRLPYSFSSAIPLLSQMKIVNLRMVMLGFRNMRDLEALCVFGYWGLKLTSSYFAIIYDIYDVISKEKYRQISYFSDISSNTEKEMNDDLHALGSFF